MRSPSLSNITLIIIALMAPSLAWAQAQDEERGVLERGIAPARGQLHVIVGPNASSTLGQREGGYELQRLTNQETWISLHRLTLHTQVGLLDSLMLGVGIDGLLGQYTHLSEPTLSLQYTHRHGQLSQLGGRVSVTPAIWSEGGAVVSVALPARWRISERWALESAGQISLISASPKLEAFVRVTHAPTDAMFIGLESKLAFAGNFSQTHLPLWALFGYQVFKGQGAAQGLDLTLKAGLPGGYYFFRETPLRWRNFTINIGAIARFGELW